MCLEEKLMEEIELSAEQRDFAIASQKLAQKIRDASARVGYDLTAACALVNDGQLTVHMHLPDDPTGVMGFVGLPVEVALYLTANTCGGLFPQAPAPKE